MCLRKHTKNKQSNIKPKLLRSQHEIKLSIEWNIRRFLIHVWFWNFCYRKMVILAANKTAPLLFQPTSAMQCSPVQIQCSFRCAGRYIYSNEIAHKSHKNLLWFSICLYICTFDFGSVRTLNARGGRERERSPDYGIQNRYFHCLHVFLFCPANFFFPIVKNLFSRASFALRQCKCFYKILKRIINNTTINHRKCVIVVHLQYSYYYGYDNNNNMQESNVSALFMHAFSFFSLLNMRFYAEHFCTSFTTILSIIWGQKIGGEKNEIEHKKK